MGMCLIFLLLFPNIPSFKHTLWSHSAVYFPKDLHRRSLEWSGSPLLLQWDCPRKQDLPWIGASMWDVHTRKPYWDTCPWRAQASPVLEPWPGWQLHVSSHSAWVSGPLVLLALVMGHHCSGRTWWMSLLLWVESPGWRWWPWEFDIVPRDCLYLVEWKRSTNNLKKCQNRNIFLLVNYAFQRSLALTYLP